VGLMGGHMLALDEKTGNPIWNQKVGKDPVRSNQNVAAAPVYWDGTVFTSVTTGEGRYVGNAIALDANDGHELWRFDVIPQPGQPGHDTWPQGNNWQMGGADVWLPPAVDPALGLVYYGTGSPSPQHLGGVRPGTNLYSGCVVALDMKTGKLRWYYQLTHHDMWEGDVATPVLLYDVQTDRGMQKGVAAIRVDGTVFLLDRETGKPLVPTEERAVPQDSFTKTWPTQPFPVGGGSAIERDCSWWSGKIPAGFGFSCSFFTPWNTDSDKPNLLSRGPWTRFEPMSYDPQTGYLYVQGKDQLEWNWQSRRPFTWDFSDFFLLTRVPGVNKDAALIFAAVDTRNDKVVWRKEMRYTASWGVGGWLTTGGGLAFHRLEDGNFQAYDAKTGKELWKFQTGYAGGEGSAMSYEVDGQQYVAVTEGQELWSFSLDGKVPARTAPTLDPIDATFAGPITDTLLVETSAPNEADYRHAFSPLRARVTVGTPVTFVNNGDEPHTIVAQDGSWKTTTLLPRESAIITFDKPGHYLYFCQNHPWSYGELFVVSDSASSAEANTSFTGQAIRGKAQYQARCALCHGAELNGNGEAAPALTGSGFVTKWQGKKVRSLFDKIRTSMPPDAPASLTDDQYMGMVAYILQANEFASPGHSLDVNAARDIDIARK